MTCRKGAQFIDDFVDGELSAGLKEEFEWHLNSCQVCRTDIQERNRLKELLRSYIIREPGEDYFATALESILMRTIGQRETVIRLH